MDEKNVSNKIDLYSKDSKKGTFLQKGSQETKTILQPEDSKKPLKLSKEEIGRHSWALLHSMAAAAPNIPSEEQKQFYKNFLFSLAEVYPCKICAKHLKQMLTDIPFRYKSREELVYYLCELHNDVNKRLNKEIYDCK